MTDFRLLRQRRLLPRRGPLRQRRLDPLHLRRCPRHRKRVLRRKEQHRFWGVDCYSDDEGRNLGIGNRLFHEEPGPGGGTFGPGGGRRRRVGQGSWQVRTSQRTTRPPCSAPPTASAPRRWCCVPPGTWCPTRPAIPTVGRPENAEPVAPGKPGHGRHRRQDRPPAVHGRLPVSRHARLLAGRGGQERIRRRGAPPSPAICRQPAWWRCSTGGTTCRNWG